MATEKCSTCCLDSTPWSSTPELGTGRHMCNSCSYDFPVFARAFDKYLEHIAYESDIDGESMLKSSRPIEVKKMTYLLIKRWYNNKIKKGNNE